MRPVHFILALAASFLAQSIMAQGVGGDSNRPWRDPVYNVDVAEHIYGYGEVQFASPLALWLDLYEPTGPNVPGRRRPAILMIHGGAFVGGSRRFPPLGSDGN